MNIESIKDYEFVIQREMDKKLSEHKKEVITRLMLFAFRHGILFNNNSLKRKDIIGDIFEEI